MLALMLVLHRGQRLRNSSSSNSSERSNKTVKQDDAFYPASTKCDRA
jgi:hypothetical protein